MKKLLFSIAIISVLCITSQLECFKVQIKLLNHNLGLSTVSIATGERGTQERKDVGVAQSSDKISEEFFAEALPLRLTINASTHFNISKEFKKLVEKELLDKKGITLDDLNTPDKVILTINIGGDRRDIKDPEIVLAKIDPKEEMEKEINRLNAIIAKIDKESETCRKTIQTNEKEKAKYQNQLNDLEESSSEDTPQ
jgi:hypothetical protein